MDSCEQCNQLLAISSLINELQAFQEGLCSLELVIVISQIAHLLYTLNSDIILSAF